MIAAKSIQSNVGSEPGMFRNLMQAWGSIQSSDPTYPQYLNKDGLPNGTLGASGIGGTIKVPPSYTGTMVFAWTGTISGGTGAITMDPGAPGFTVTAGSQFVQNFGSTGNQVRFQGTNGYVEFNYNAAPPTTNVSFNAGCTFSGVTSLIFCRKSDYAALTGITDPGQMFTDEWTAKVASLNLNSIRSLGLWDVNNFPTFTQHRYRKDWKNGISLGLGWVRTCWSGSTTGGPAYTIAANTDTPAAYTRGEVVQCAVATASAVAITALGAITAGSAYTNGTYNGVALTGGSGSGATANITVSGGAVTAVTLVSGTPTSGGYRVGDVLSAAASTIGGTGSGFSIPVSTTSAALTANVGGRGVVPLFDMAGLALTNLAANTSTTMFYDDLLGGYVTAAGHGYGADLGTMPIEMLVGLANRLTCGLWLALPPHITLTNSVMEGGSNSVAQMAAYVSANLLLGEALFELGNELWNFGYPYTFQNQFFANCGLKVGFPSDNNRRLYGWHGYRTAQMADAVASAWVGGGVPAKIVSAFQAFSTTTALKTYRLQGADLAPVANGGQGNATWASYTGNANLTASPNRPVDKTDVLAYATYYSGHNCTNFDGNWTLAKFNAVKVWADLYQTGTAANIDSALQSLDADIAGPASDQTTEDLNAGVYPYWEAVAAAFDGARPSGKTNLEIRAYEGAFESNYPSTSQCTTLGVATTYGGSTGYVANLLDGYKRSPYFYRRVLRQMKQMVAASPSRKVVPCWFLISPFSQWSMVSGSDFNSSTYQSYDVVKLTNGGRRRFYAS
ncbi:MULTISPECIES: hypothetical protein [unclassified Bradyrhizobium]|uniref:hypothetical protein n=1 Tax=unclassified Bradyrhizobium TaxID=2631580 RepID=UPI002915DC2E|nr:MULTISPECIES: hypothetical protein [unclassified Bradyrhizobium]